MVIFHSYVTVYQRVTSNTFIVKSHAKSRLRHPWRPRLAQGTKVFRQKGFRCFTFAIKDVHDDQIIERQAAGGLGTGGHIP